MANTIKVVIIAYEFPPLNSGGSHRPFRFAKYLQEQGIANCIVSVNEASYTGKIDRKLGGEYLSLLNIHRTTTKELTYRWIYDRYYINLVDSVAKTWEKELRQKLASLVKLQKPKYLLCTVPPFSLAPLSIRLGEELDIPVILDFRDAWSQWVISPYASYLHYYMLLQLEKSCLKKASKILVTSLQTIKDFQNLNPEINKDKFLYIPNSFDEFAGNFVVPDFTKVMKIRVGYVGSFYFEPEREMLFTKKWWQKKPYQYLQYSPKRERWLYRSPYYFFMVVRKLLDIHPEFNQRLELCFAGNKPSWFDDMVQSHQLSERISHYGFLNKKEAIDFQKSCDLLLITSAKIDGGRDYSIAGKTFEYFSLQKPILALVSEGAQKDILEKSGIALVLNPDDIEESAKVMYQLLINNLTLTPNMDFITQFKTEKTLEPLVTLLR